MHRFAGLILSGLTFVNGVQIAEAQEGPCIQSVGAKKAAQYAHECFLVEESTHWPCNAKASCTDIISSIRQGCRDIHETLVLHPEARTNSPLREPSFCKRYLEIQEIPEQ